MPEAARFKPYRVALCITELEVGGAEQCLVSLATGLDRRRFRPTVFCLAPPGPLVEPLAAAGVPAVCLGARRPWHLGVAPRLARALSRWRPHLVHTFLFHANIVGRLAARAAGVGPVLSSVRVAERRFRSHLVLDTLTCRLAAAEVCVSRAVADFTHRRAHVPRSRLRVIPNGVEVERFAHGAAIDRADLDLPPEAQVVLFAGRLDRQKGVDGLVDAAARLVPDHPRLRFVIAGRGPERSRLERQAAALGLADRVRFLGWRADVAALLRASDLLVLPSLWEGMPNVVLEAMAAGLPVVATAVEGTAELVLPGVTGELVPPGAPAALARAIDRLVADPALARQFGRAGRRRVAEHFSRAAMIAGYQRLYDDLLQSSAPRGGDEEPTRERADWRSYNPDVSE